MNLDITQGSVFATADDGTPLHWLTALPPGSGRVPFVVGVHGGGFWAGNDNSPIRKCGPSLTAAGFGLVSPEYRLCPPGGLAGQKSDGCYPDQTNDVQLAIDAARAHPRCNGSVQVLGGSAGGYFAAWFAALGIAHGIGMSPPTKLDEPFSDGKYEKLCATYAPGQLLEASPWSHVTPSSKGFFMRFYEKDRIPFACYTKFEDVLNTNQVSNNCKVLPGMGHSFVMWPIIKTEAIAWLKMMA